jgi:hypothetical protein
METTTTGADGSYSFTGLVPGNYTVTQTQPSAYLAGKDTVGTPVGGTNPAPNVLTVPLTPMGMNINAVNYNYGSLEPSSISGMVYLDVNNVGMIQPGSPGIPGVTIILTGTDTDGRAVMLTTTTDANGDYSFTRLYPGSYDVTEVQPAGYLPAATSAGSFGGSESVNLVSGVNVPIGDNGVDYLFGQILPAEISGTVYYDYDRNGVLSAPDFGIANVLVALTGVNDVGQMISISTHTNKDGYYDFDDLRPGTYQVQEFAPKVFIPELANVGTTGGVAGKRILSQIPLPLAADSQQNNFPELQNPNCDLADIAFHVGRTFARDMKRFNANPARFKVVDPKMAKYLAEGVVPKGMGTYPVAPLAYKWVPTLGTKEVPYEPWVSPVKIVDGHIHTNGKAPEPVPPPRAGARHKETSVVRHHKV